MTQTAYELKLAKYEGPIQKLLELIEARKLEITEISLGEVTDDFLKHLESLKRAGAEEGGSSLRLLAEFIVVASRLIFIKSKSLLPDFNLTGEEEAEIKDLTERLKFYREMRPALKNIAELWREKEAAFARPYLMSLGLWMVPRPDLERHQNGSDLRFFYPGGNVSDSALAQSLKRLLSTFEEYIKEAEVVHEKIINLDEKIREIIARLEGLESANFRDLAQGRGKQDQIATFLAVLHLAREQMLLVEQEGRDSDIIIKRASAKQHGDV